ncbi:hypothetical protein BB559_007384 [Furculomyces boomerangus]|uniref:Uncharacterized protein n=2 Tax=Harpellales TaxID=61421 RepID=A0A2T9XXM2_9FUNG|nr:hypothetical protein BB559_007384 [Furculomyces boomerangus]PVZ98771.1 hypothetical protein BB558_005221 [Smittium angustum]
MIGLKTNSFRIIYRAGLLSRSQRAAFSITPRSFQAATGTQKTESETPKSKSKPIGGFRGGIFGFLLGATVAGSYGFYYLIDQYQKASSLVLSSVDELEKTATDVKDYVRKIDNMETLLGDIKSSTAEKDELIQFKSDWRKQVDIIMKDYLELKAHLWRVEQDLDAANAKIAELEEKK